MCLKCGYSYVDWWCLWQSERIVFFFLNLNCLEPIQTVSQGASILSPTVATMNASFSRLISSQSPCSPDVVVIATISEDPSKFWTVHRRRKAWKSLNSWHFLEWIVIILAKYCLKLWFSFRESCAIREFVWSHIKHLASAYSTIGSYNCVVYYTSMCHGKMTRVRPCFYKAFNSDFHTDSNFLTPEIKEAYLYLYLCLKHK